MEQKLQEILEYYKGLDTRKEQETIVEMLREIQELIGCIPVDVQERIEKELDIKQTMIATLIRLYPSLKSANYKHRVIACTGARCAAKDGATILAEIRKELQIQEDGLSKDGIFYLTTQNCLKSCKTSPNFYVDGVLYQNVKVEEIPEIFQKIRG